MSNGRQITLKDKKEKYVSLPIKGAMCEKPFISNALRGVQKQFCPPKLGKIQNEVLNEHQNLRRNHGIWKNERRYQLYE